MEIFALFMLCGIFTTLLIPETKRRTLEELAGEVPGTANYDPVTAGHEGFESRMGMAERGSSGEGSEEEKKVVA